MRTSILLVLIIRLVGPMVFCQGADALTIAWGDLRNLVAGRPMTVDTRDRQRLRGWLVSQYESGLQLSITDAKPRGQHAKNATVRVDRNQIQRLRVVKNPGKVSGRIAGLFIGFFAGGYLGTIAGGGEQNLGGAIGYLGGPVVGYFLGRSLDRETIDITILDTASNKPEDSPTSPSARLPEYLRAHPLGGDPEWVLQSAAR